MVKLSEKQKQQGWQIVKFGDVAKEVKQTIQNAVEAGLKFYVGLEHLEPQSLRIERKGIIAEDNPSFTRVFKTGQILFGKRRCYQKKAAVADFEGICSSDIIVMEAIAEKIIPQLLPFIIQSDAFFNWAEKTSSGSLSPRTKWKSLAEFKFPLPPLERQKEILEVLEKIETSFFSNNAAINSSQMLKKVLMQRLFTRGVGDRKFKNNKIDKIPKNWEEKHLFSILSIVNRKEKVKHHQEYSLLGVRLYGKGCRVHSKIMGKELKVSTLNRVKEGDITYNKMWTSKTAFGIVAPEYDGLYVTNEYPTFRVDSAQLYNLYLFYYMCTPWFTNITTPLCRGTTSRSRLNPKDFLKIKIMLPSIAEQKKIVEILIAIDKEINILNQQVSRTQQLMQRLLNGL